ncbi:MAG TPA: hypothetical protein VF913_18550 [Xanthobacteraceae bacterium]
MSNITAIRPDSTRHAQINKIGTDSYALTTGWLRLVLNERGPGEFEREVTSLICRLAGIAQRELGHDAAEHMLAMVDAVLLRGC